MNSFNENYDINEIKLFLIHVLSKSQPNSKEGSLCHFTLKSTSHTIFISIENVLGVWVSWKNLSLV